VHLRGVDDLHTNDILGFANDYFPEAEPHVQWVDDTSANIVFKSAEQARAAILAFVANPVSLDEVLNAPFALRQAKPLASRPAAPLMVRIAQVGDRKRKNARDASRYYLLHPDQDPTEHMRREFANSRTRGGGRENGEYTRRRFDEREHRRRRDKDQDAGGEANFEASMYDDAPATEKPRGRDLFSRVTKSRRRSASPGADGSDIDMSGSEDSRPRRRRNDYRDRDERPPPYSKRDPAPFPRANTGKELFSSERTRPSDRKEGALHSDRLELLPASSSTSNTPTLTRQNSSGLDRSTNLAAARRLKADLLASTQTSPRGNHRRSHAMDAKNAEDLSQRFARKSISIDSTKAANAGVELFPSSNSNNSINIKGQAADQGFSIKGSGGLSIKGRATEVKELFPQQYSREGNRGKELFDSPVRQKGRRQRAGDLFD